MEEQQKSYYSTHIDRLLPRFLQIICNDTKNDFTTVISKYKMLHDLAIQAYEESHDISIIDNVIGMDNVLYKYHQQRLREAIVQDVSHVCKLCNETSANLFDEMNAIIFVDADDNSLRKSNIIHTHIDHINNNEGEAQQIMVFDTISQNEVSRTYSYPMQKEQIIESYPKNHDKIFNIFNQWFKQAGVNAYIDNGEFYGPIIKGMSSDGYAYTRIGRNGAPRTGMIDYTEFCHIANANIMKLHSAEEGVYNAVKVQFYRYNNDNVITEYYPIDEAVINKYFTESINVIKAIIQHVSKKSSTNE